MFIKPGKTDDNNDLLLDIIFSRIIWKTSC